MSATLATGLSVPVLAYCLVVVFLAAIVRGYSGFGFSALVVTSLSLVMAPVAVVPTALILEIVASIHILPRVYKDVDRRLVGWLFGGSLIALPFGVLLLAVLPAASMRGALYVICLGAVAAIWRGFRVHGGHGRRHTFAAGLIAGAVNGATAMGGLMVAIFLLTGPMAAASIRASMIAYFLIMDIAATALTGAGNMLNAEVLVRTAVLTPPLLLGNALGNRRFVVAAPESFRRFTMGLLMTISAVGLIRTLYGG